MLSAASSRCSPIFRPPLFFETIPDFHNTPLRYQALLQAAQADPKGRLKNVSDEMAFFLDHADDYGVAERMKASGELPLRVTHNDTKLNNVMIDDKTGEGICVIDLEHHYAGTVDL